MTAACCSKDDDDGLMRFYGGHNGDEEEQHLNRERNPASTSKNVPINEQALAACSNDLALCTVPIGLKVPKDEN